MRAGDEFIACSRGRWPRPKPTAAQRELRPGDAVDVRLDNGELMRTTVRSRPWQLGHGQWVVKVIGYVGGFALERVTPVPRQAELALPGVR